MILVGLTGGIGSGKSTVSSLLAEAGAIVIDADLIARQVVEPGQPAYEALVGRFGRGVLAADRTIDRPALASLVFSDEQARSDLEAITHPAIAQVISERISEETSTGHVVVLDAALLVESAGRRPEMKGVMVVDTPPEVALDRLVRERRMGRDDARARMASQAPRAKRLEKADFVIDNSGDLPALRRRVGEALEWIESLTRAPAG